MIGVIELINHYSNVDMEAVIYITAIKNVLKSKEPKTYKTIIELYNKNKDVSVLKKFVSISPYKYRLQQNIEEVTLMYERQRQRGINVHESLSGKSSTHITHPNHANGFQFNINTIKDGVYVEKFISGDYICGIVDKFIITTIDGKRYVSIIDYKTGVALGKNYGYMKHPISHLTESKFTKACLQLSFYALLFIKKGFIVKDMVIILKRDGMKDIDYIPIFYKKECLDMVIHHKQLNQK